jgi:hypothetical protein
MRRRSWRGRRLNKNKLQVILAALVGAISALTLLVFFGARLAAPGDGTQVIFPPSGLVTEGVPVKPFVPATDGLQTNDLVTAIDGHTANALIRDAFTGQWDNSALLQKPTLDYTVLRDGRPLSVQVRPGPFPLARALEESWSIYLAMLLICLVAFFVFVRRPHLHAAQLFFVSCALGAASTMVWTMQHQASDLLRGWVFPFEMAANTPLYFLGLSAVLHFLLVFPRRHPLIIRYPRLVLWNYLGIWLIAIASVLLRLPAAPTPVALLQLEMESENLTLLYFLFIVLAIFSNLRRPADETERRQMRWIAWGMLVGLSAMGILVTLAIALDLPIQYFLAVAGLFLFAIPLSMAIAILRENLFDINLILNRTLVYIPLTAILAGLFAASITLSQRLFFSLTGQQSDAATVLTTLVVVAAFDPIKTALQKLVDRRFKEAPDPLKRLNGFGNQLQSVLLVFDAEQTARRFLDEAVAAFGAESGALHLKKNGDAELLYCKGEWKGTPSLSAPLQNNGSDFGRIELGARRIGSPYTEQDRTAFQNNANVVARALALAERTNTNPNS